MASKRSIVHNASQGRSRRRRALGGYLLTYLVDLCRCFGAPARRVFPDHLITYLVEGSVQTGQCSAARTDTPPRAVRPSRWRDHEAARSNRRESPGSVPVASQWCAQDGAGQPARTAWPPRRHPSRGWGRHTGALHAACGRSHVPGVMTTTLLRVNAQELRRGAPRSRRTRTMRQLVAAGPNRLSLQ
jgi:hypothetical protein